jgi:light-regulated signal transduction histidine kinase (bacteriophytochrome)
MLEEDYQKLLDVDGNKILGSIKNNSKKMNNLIDDLLAFSRLGSKAPKKSNLDINKMVSGILAVLQETTKYKAEIKVENLFPTKGDLSLINQVFVNLISNGIKYSSKKSHPMVEIRSELKDDGILYEVKDNGEGFDMQYADKLFGVFQRLHSSEDFEGTGVGLAIVQRIIHKHGGKVWAQAEPGKGATFSFTLPN